MSSDFKIPEMLDGSIVSPDLLKTQDLSAAETTHLVCPVCKRPPQYITQERDRGLHPAITQGRYSCGLYGHIVASTFVDVGLCGNKEDPSLEIAARRAWLNEMADAGHVSDDLKTACETLQKELSCLDVAAIPTKSEVYVRCGRPARDIYDAIKTVTNHVYRPD